MDEDKAVVNLRLQSSRNPGRNGKVRGNDGCADGTNTGFQSAMRSGDRIQRPTTAPDVGESTDRPDSGSPVSGTYEGRSAKVSELFEDPFGPTVGFCELCPHCQRKKALTLEAKAIVEFDKAMNVRASMVSKAVSRRLNIPRDAIIGTSHRAKIVNARQLVCYLVRRLTPLSYSQIGKLVNRDHATVVHSIQKISKRMNQQLAYAQMIEKWLTEFGQI